MHTLSDNSLMKKQKGFTIIELLIVLTIGGILASLALPSMRDGLLNTRAKTSASDAHVSFLFARSEAIKRNSSITVTAASGWTNGWTIKTGSTTLRQQDALPANITVTCSGTCPTTITYEKTGRASPSTELRIYVNGNNKIKMRCVSLSLSGKPLIELDTNAQTYLEKLSITKTHLTISDEKKYAVAMVVLEL